MSLPATADSERLLALKFLLHFVGDLHQPLHAADDHDAGGTEEPDVAEGFHPGNLHHYWDIEFVERLGTDPRRVAASLIGQISDAQRQEWASGKPADWAMEAFALARSDARARPRVDGIPGAAPGVAARGGLGPTGPMITPSPSSAACIAK